MSAYERGKRAGERIASHCGTFTSPGFHTIAYQVAAWQAAQNAATREDRGWFLGCLRGLRGPW